MRRVGCLALVWVWAGIALGQHAGRAPGWVDPPVDIEYATYPMNWSKADESLLDLSGFLDKPAGQHGFVRRREGQLFDGAGRRFRIWGINMGAEDCYPPKALAPLVARDLARMGFNYVRMHHMDAGFGPVNLFRDDLDNTRSLDSERLDRLDFFVAELKKHGVYTNFNLNNSRRFRAGDGVRDRKPLDVGKCATYFNPRLIELQHEYARNLLDRVNRYTGNHYRDEPALMVVELVNENSLIEGWLMDRIHGPNPDGRTMFGSLPKSYALELDLLFNQWLAENRPEESIEALRAETNIGPGGLIPRLRPPEFAAASAQRFHTEAAFYMELERSFFKGFKRLLRDELGIKSLLVGPADHNDGAAMMPHLKTLAEEFDFIDGHGYWEHPQLEKPHWVRNSPMVNDPLDSSYNQFARTPVLGVPFVVGETSGPYPGDYGAEVFPILAAYALHQDWDGLCWFYYGPGRKDGDGAGVDGFFALGNDPVRSAAMAASAAMFHRGDVARARRMVVRGYDESSTLDAMRMERSTARPFFHRGHDLSTALRHAVRLTFDPAKATSLPQDEATDGYATDTGEITWMGAMAKRGLVAIDTPATQGLVGFSKETSHDLPHLGSHLANPFATVVLTSLTRDAIAASEKLLLFVGSRSANTGLAFQADHQTILALGRGPTRIERIRGEVTVKGLDRLDQLRVTPLGGVGEAIGPPRVLPVKGGAVAIAVGEPATVWYLLEPLRSSTTPAGRN